MENLEFAVGRRKKFGEESGFVNVRVPKSKVSEYRAAIKRLVDEKFSRDSCELNKEEGKGITEKKTVTFRDFREFGKELDEGTASEPAYENDFIAEVFEEVERLGQEKKKLRE